MPFLRLGNNEIPFEKLTKEDIAEYVEQSRKDFPYRTIAKIFRNIAKENTEPRIKELFNYGADYARKREIESGERVNTRRFVREEEGYYDKHW